MVTAKKVRHVECFAERSLSYLQYKQRMEKHAQSYISNSFIYYCTIFSMTGSLRISEMADIVRQSMDLAADNKSH